MVKLLAAQSTPKTTNFGRKGGRSLQNSEGAEGLSADGADLMPQMGLTQAICLAYDPPFSAGSANGHRSLVFTVSFVRAAHFLLVSTLSGRGRVVRLCPGSIG